MVTKIETGSQMHKSRADFHSQSLTMQTRSQDRMPLTARCQVRSGHGLAQQGAISDISSHGCSLNVPRLALRRADRVSLNLGGVRNLDAEVCWTRAGQGAGLRFRRPLSTGMIEVIMRKARDESIAGVAMPVDAGEKRVFCPV